MCLQVLEAMRVSYVGVRLAITKGFRKVGKKLVGSCFGIVRNTGMEPRLKAHLTEHGLPDNYEDIPSEESAEMSDPEGTDRTPPNRSQYNEAWTSGQNAWDNYVSTEHVGPSYVHEVNFTKYYINFYSICVVVDLNYMFVVGIGGARWMVTMDSTCCQTPIMN